jgi:integrase/recombinase XerD
VAQFTSKPRDYKSGLNLDYFGTRYFSGAQGRLTGPDEPLTLDYLTEMVRGYADAADVGKRGACHLFRHTMATLMLEGGADIRFIQAMLGHADLKTSHIYTHVAIRQL